MNIKKGTIMCMAIVMLGSTPVYAADDISVNQIKETTLIQMRSNTVTYPSRTITNNQISAFNNGGSVFALYKGSKATFVCNFNKSAKVEIGFYNMSSGTYKKLYTGKVQKKTVTYSPTSTVRGYFYVKNLSGSSITLSSAKVTI